MSQHHRIGDLVSGQLRHSTEVLAHHRRVDRIGLRIGGQLVRCGGEVGEVGAHRFDEQREGDLISGSATVKVLVDAFSAKYLGGTQVDFSDELTGGGFKLNNPNAKQSCGCGKSFQT